MARTARQISNLVIDEISLVDKGANQHAVVTIAKNANGGSKENEMDIFDEQGNPLDVAELDEGDVVYDEEGNAYSMEFDGASEEENAEEMEHDEDLEPVGKAWSPRGLRSGTKAAKVVQDTLPGMSTGAVKRGQRGAAIRRGIERGGAARQATNTRVRDFVGNSRLQGPYNSAVAGGHRTAGHVSRHRGAYGAAGGAAATGGGFAAYDYNSRKGVRKSFDFADEVREELSKALTDRDREEVITKALGRVDEMAQEMEIAKALAEEERELRIEREYTEIAKSYNLPFADEDLGRVLMHAAEALPDEDNAIIHKAFAAAGEAVFEEYGLVGGGDNADVYSQVEAAIDGMVTKSGVTREEALAEFFYENPGAYDEYLSER